MTRFCTCTLLFLFIFSISSVWAVPPVVNYAGQVRVAGQPFTGVGYLKFAFVNAGGSTTYWSHDGTSLAGSEPTGELSVQVRGGLYSILLGNDAIAGMAPIDLSLFQQYNDVHIRVWFNDGERGFQHLRPDRPFTSVPYALSAGTAGSAGIAPGAVSLNMLSSDVQTSLSSTIDRSRLSSEVRADLNRTVRLADLSPAVLGEINATIGMGRLGGDVTALLNRTISKSMLGGDVLGDLNATIDRARLSADVRADLNKTIVITRDMLPADVRNDLNRTITLSDLAPEVVADLNDSVGPGTITTELLNEQILKYLRPEVVRSPKLPQNREKVYTGQSVTLSADAEGKYLTYQWLRNGQEISGATNKEFTISDANATSHNGNYSVRISNDFGNVSTTSVQLDVNDTQLIHEADLNASVSMEMIWVEPGSFMMGQDGVATPEHNVTLTKGFYLGKYEVTQAQYEAVMTGNSDGLSATPSKWPNNADRPVEKVSHDDIQKFLTRLNAQESGNIPAGWAYVLPTEAQWEYACRAGTTTVYSWGDNISASDANYNSNIGQTADVGQYSANPWGFFDMHGNVWEWTADWYVGYSSGAQTDPEGPATGSARLARGGSWNLPGTYLRTADRTNGFPSSRVYHFGFRVGFQQLAADVASPEMSIIGDANITQLQGVAWVDPGVEAHDVRDGNLTSSVSVSGTVDVNATGTYTLTYTVSDAAGNDASLTRTVTVVAGQASTHTADLNASVSMEMIWVQPGSFMMGQSNISNASPEHNVTLTKGFYLGKYEVTQAQYEAVMTGNSDGLSATPSNWPNNADRPVEKVSWDDIQKFLTRLNAQESGNIPAGWSYVLPTEAQWEYACRAGTTTAYSWGDNISASDANWNHGNDANQTENVGQYSANSWGFFDMHGNVWEWTADRYAAYSSGAQTDPEGSATGSDRVFRGGSWGNTGTSLRSAFRVNSGPGFRVNDIGFRVGFQQQSADVASPEMSIFGDANITQLQGVAWVDPGVEAHDVRDGHLTSSVSVSGTVDVNATGTYTLTYTVSDAAGNNASLTRTVNIVAGQASTHTADLNASVSMEMIWVQPGSFTMGQSDISDASPEHNVTLTNGFYLGKYEVTQAQYEAVMTGNSDGLSATPSNWPNNADRPVEKVSWEDIQKFLTRLNAQESGNIPAGWSYVLPTEAQWEYACRAGTTTAYSWGDSITADNANYNSSGYSQTRDVGLYDANPWGFFDMDGNVNEWTADWYGGYSSGAQTDPEGSASGSSRVLRGGSWSNSGPTLRSAYRNYGFTPSTRLFYIGFRVGFQQQSADVASPEMSILGDANITQLQGVAWVDPGVEAHDVRDGNLTSSISVSGTVDVNTTGTYTLTYTVSDAAGNNASLTRTVNIVAGQASTHTADLNASVSMEMIWVQPGSFMMGSPTTEAGRNMDETEHNVTLTKGFYLGKYEVTQSQYEAVMTGNSDGLSAIPSSFSGYPNRPVEQVSWDDIQKFLTRLNAQESGNIPEGWEYVLPTEAQWEYACRAGTTTAYWWGNDINSTNANYNWDGEWNTGNDFKETRDVGQYAQNMWGFFDMHGNVWEWTADWYGNYPTSNSVIDPIGSTSGSERVSRGGSWNGVGPRLRSAQRSNLVSPSSSSLHIGFRLAYMFTGERTVDLNSSVNLEMIWVQPGSFMMGQDGVATPEHNVTLTNGFYLGKYEVTQAQYEAVMTGNSDGLSATPSEWPNNANRPVEKVSHDDIQKFLTRLNAQESGNIPAGWSYVLPTEAQWEYACRAGTTTVYSWGDDINSSRANYNWDGAYNTGIDFKQTRDVGQYSANPWGFFDMHGNVHEWTADWYGGYSSGAQTDPEGSATGSTRVIRGGSWLTTGTSLRSAYRLNINPSYRNYYIGFRVGFQQQSADVASPEMSILGDANITQLQGVAWVDPGVEAHDVRDGNLTSSVSVSGTVDVNATGTYTLTYTVSDAAGNNASLTRTVNIVAGQASTHTADLNASVSMEMIWVEPGSFMMGQSDISNASPEHNVTLTNGFYLGKYEVTQSQYEAVMTGNSDGLSATPSHYGGNADRPVEQVSHDDIQKFLTRLNAQESGNIPAGWSYVLPTEAQWEYACRAGTTTAYSWGDSITADNANYSSSGYSQTRDVGLYDANPWGFFDMHGNVNEWTADWYGGYSSGAQTDPEGSATGSNRVYRGGSWSNSGTTLRSAIRRSNFNPSYRTNIVGFRVGFQQQ